MRVESTQGDCGPSRFSSDLRRLSRRVRRRPHAGATLISCRTKCIFWIALAGTDASTPELLKKLGISSTNRVSIARQAANLALATTTQTDYEALPQSFLYGFLKKKLASDD